LIIVEKTPSGYSAHSPVVPDSGSTGQTKEEVDRNIQEARLKVCAMAAQFPNLQPILHTSTLLRTTLWLSASSIFGLG